MDGDAYQDGSGATPPEPKDDDAYTRPMSVWDRISDALADDDNDLKPVEIGMQGRNATTLGYGKNGLRDELDAIGEECDDLKHGFFTMMINTDDDNDLGLKKTASLIDILQSIDQDADITDYSDNDIYQGWGEDDEDNC